MNYEGAGLCLTACTGISGPAENRSEAQNELRVDFNRSSSLIHTNRNKEPVLRMNASHR
jgi:hypothetical protein